jgi:hypothetical protein
MDQRRAYLKNLAARSARRWSAAPLAPCFAGETRIETRNTVYQLRDGVCYVVTRREDAGAGRMHPSAFVGMRIVGWLLRDDPEVGITSEWRPGAYAVLWRPREGSEEHSAVALTSASLGFRVVARSVGAQARTPTFRPPAPPPPAPATVRSGRSSTPPPLPLAIPRSTVLPRPPAPPSWIPPAPSSMTRLHMEGVPEAPETPTPLAQRRSSVPPPLPPKAQGIRPMPLREPVHG